MAALNTQDTVQEPPGLQPLQQVITEPPISTSTGQMRMDPRTSRAHVIGGSHPTSADFQAMLNQQSGLQPPVWQQQQHQQQHQQQQHHQQHQQQHQQYKDPFNWRDAFIAFLKSPIIVAIIVFILNLPVITATLSRYASWMYLSSGEISVGGLCVKAILGALMFSVYQGASQVLTS